MSNTKQSHSGSGDNVGGNKILNLTIPKLIGIGIIIVLLLFTFVYWKSVVERFFFNPDKINLDISAIDSLQIVGLNKDEKMVYEEKDVIYYEYNLIGDTLRIYPSGNYLDKFKRNVEFGEAPISGLYSKIPMINFKITNNSNKTIFFSKVVLDVASSEVDPQPLPLLYSDVCYDYFPDDSVRVSTKRRNQREDLMPSSEDEEEEEEEPYPIKPIAIYNEGWSPMKNVRVSFNLIRSGEPDYLNTPFEAFFLEIKRQRNIDLLSFFRRQGVNIDSLNKIANNIFKNNNILDSAFYTNFFRHGLGIYSDANFVCNGCSIWDANDDARIYGFIEYDDIKNQHYKIKFNLDIGVIRIAEGCGAQAPMGETYNVELCENGKAYQIVYPVSQYVKTGEVDNFNIRLTCSKSSIHRIRARLYYNSKDYIERYIDYHLVLPRTMFEEGDLKFIGDGKCLK